MMRKVKLSELGVISTGNTPSKKNEKYFNSNDIMFIKPDDLSLERIKYIKKSKEYISIEARDKARIIEKNSILVTCIGTIGKIGILDSDIGAFNQQINAITPHIDIINNRYLAYLIMYDRIKLESISNAPIVPIINKSRFSEFEVCIEDSLEVQEKIANTLDKAWELVEKRKEQIKELDELIQSVFDDMFNREQNFDIVRIKDLVKNKSDIVDGPFGSNLKVSDYVEDGIRVIQINNIGINSFKNKNKRFVTIDKYKSLEKHRVKPDDIIVAKMGEPIGRCCILPDYIKEAVIVADCMRIIPDESIVNRLFLSYLLNMEYTKIQFRKYSQGSTRIRLNLTMLREVEIKLPPIELQNKFAGIVQNIEKQKEVLQQSLKELEDNFNSLMQKAFKGELFRD